MKKMISSRTRIMQITRNITKSFNNKKEHDQQYEIFPEFSEVRWFDSSWYTQPVLLLI
jgi:hypothetical protein